MSRRLKYATFCSGIECMSVACRGLPLDPVFFSEIEPFPCAILKANYPTIPNLGDMSKIRRDENGNITNGATTIPFPDGGIDILAAGCPCQDYSIAGKRAGGAEGSGTRSSLIFEFIRIIREFRPRYFIYENVPGMFTTNEGRDFANVIMEMGDCGYSLAWRVLDAQYVRVDGVERAVPQRRRRVWVVGYSGADESRAAQILLEPDCVAGHTPPRRITGQGFAYTLGGRDCVDAGLVGGAPGTCGEEQDGRGGCLNPGHPQTHRIYGADGAWPTLEAGSETSGQDQRGVCISLTPKQQSLATADQCAGPIIGTDYKEPQCIALDGDKLKPREDQRKGGNGFGINETGAGYTVTATDRHGVAYGYHHYEAGGVKTVAKEVEPCLLSGGGGNGFNNSVIQCYENHAQDCRVKPIEVSDTRNQKDGTGGNNLPLVVHKSFAHTPFVKTSHARGKDGEGERWEQGEVAGTRNTIEGGDGRTQEVVVSMAQNSRDEVRIVGGDGQVAGALAAEPGMKQQTYVVSTNSNGEDVAPTLDSTTGLSRGTGAQSDKRGGYVITQQQPKARSASK